MMVGSISPLRGLKQLVTSLRLAWVILPQKNPIIIIIIIN
jgi:hypothetical protein